jgi:hypothetical protein
VLFINIKSSRSLHWTFEAKTILLPSKLGYFQILPSHSPIIASLSSGYSVIEGVIKHNQKHIKGKNIFTFNIVFGWIYYKKNCLSLMGKISFCN